MDKEKSLSDDATFAGDVKRGSASEASIGDERTLGDNRSGQDTVIDDNEVVDLEARYKVEGTLGQGGMGAVLLATDTRLDRKVAIKRILGEAAGNRLAVQRFLTEAKAIAALNHPNIVQIYDYGRAEDGPFLTMEFVDGGSLLDHCRESPLPLDEAIDLACQLCDGLAKAHDLGIIHRDIKPANVLLTKDGTPKLTDFGLAKAEAGDHGQTMIGAVLGTPDFMPPEQRRDASLVDHRSDLWSLAATVYQMVTGRSPKIIRFDLLPAALTKVLGKALEDAKESRYQTARELRDALKVSLRSAAPATIAALGEGQCSACGVQNDSKRKFCRGCGASLESPCLKCSEPMPVWEEICGSCGVKQTPVVDERRQKMAVKQAEAEGLLGDYDFDRATLVATQLRDESHPKLQGLSAWAEAFLETIEASRAEQLRKLAEAIDEASKHEAAHDYLSAITVLESVPESLRCSQLPDASESVIDALNRLKNKQDECRRLQSLLKDRIAAKSLDGLLPDVEKLLLLQPQRTDIQKIRAQLLERQAKQAATRDDAIQLAERLLSAHDYERAQDALEAIDAAALTSKVIELRQHTDSLVKEVHGLSTRVKEAVDGKAFDGLLPDVERLLLLQPHRADIQKIRAQLLERQAKQAAARDDTIQLAERLLAAHDYERAQDALETIDAAVLTPEVSELRQRTRGLVRKVHELSRRIKEAMDCKAFDGLVPVIEEYLGLKPGDKAAVMLRQSLQERENKFGEEIAARINKAREFMTACQFAEAVRLLETVPEPRRSPEFDGLLRKANHFAHLRGHAIKKLQEIQDGSRISHTWQGDSYFVELCRAKLDDKDFKALIANTEAAQLSRARSRRIALWWYAVFSAFTIYVSIFCAYWFSLRKP